MAILEGNDGKNGFPSLFIHKIMEYITIPQFRILINDEPSASFQSIRGLRQGEPLSPFLFLICAKGLSGLI